MHLIGDRTYSDGLSPNKNYSDNYRGLSGQPMIAMSPTSNQFTATNKYQPTNNNTQSTTTLTSMINTTTVPLITLMQNANGNIKLGEDEKKHILQQRLARKQLLQQQQVLQQQPQTQPQQQPSQMPQQNEVLTNNLTSITLKNQMTVKHQHLPQHEENLLTTNEIKLCAKLNILPTEYLSIKTILLYNNNNNNDGSLNHNHNDVSNGNVINHHMNGNSNSDSNSYNTSVISNYLYKAGWRH